MTSTALETATARTRRPSIARSALGRLKAADSTFA